MNSALPTAEQLEKLSLRAIVAYASRAARRISLELRRIVANKVLDDALTRLETVMTTDSIGQVDQAAMIDASARVVAAYQDAPAEQKSVKELSMLFSIVQAALAAMHVVQAATNPLNARGQMQRAARAAERAVYPLAALRPDAAAIATDAARRDFETLLREYGEHDDVVIGDPIVCFEKADG